MKNIYIALEDLRSLYNIGAIFRTCSFFGFYNVILVGYSGKTANEHGEPILHPNILKTSLGAEKDLNIQFIPDSTGLLSYAQKNNLQIVAVEQTERSEPLHEWKPEDNAIIVFGNEVTGVSEELLDKSNKIVEVYRAGKHNSLNVTTVCGVVLYQIINKKLQ